MANDVNNLDFVNQGTSQTQESVKQNSDKELNFRKLEKKAEALEQALYERDEMLKKQQSVLEQMQSRLSPDRDEFDSLPNEELIDKARFMRVLEKERERFKKEAEEVARQTYRQIDSENYVQRLQSKYPDYDQVVNASNAEKLQESDPDFVAVLGEVKDEFKRREMAYKRIQKVLSEEKPKAKAQDVVNENRQQAANFFTPHGQGPMTNQYGFDFDVRSKEARTQAYQRLKAAQKRG